VIRDRGDEGYGVKKHIDDLILFINGFDIDEFGFVSHNLGVYMGWQIARNQLSRLRVFLLDCSYPWIGKRWRDPDHIDEIW
jgi:hypothetical protein